MSRQISLVVLLSGGGTTLRNFLECIDAGSLDVDIAAVVSSRPGVKGLERAAAAGIPAHVVARREFSDLQTFSDALTAVVDRYAPDLVAMAGFLSLWSIPERYAGRVLNIHPALIPAFCGKGYYGMRVHEAVVASGVKVTGCTVHFADNVYDHGPIVLQRTVPVRFEDSPHDVQERVFAEECLAYPSAIRLFAAGRLHLDGRRCRID